MPNNEEIKFATWEAAKKALQQHINPFLAQIGRRSTGWLRWRVSYAAQINMEVGTIRNIPAQTFINNQREEAEQHTKRWRISRWFIEVFTGYTKRQELAAYYEARLALQTICVWDAVPAPAILDEQLNHLKLAMQRLGKKDMNSTVSRLIAVLDEWRIRFNPFSEIGLERSQPRQNESKDRNESRSSPLPQPLPTSISHDFSTESPIHSLPETLAPSQQQSSLQQRKLVKKPVADNADLSEQEVIVNEGASSVDSSPLSVSLTPSYLSRRNWDQSPEYDFLGLSSPAQASSSSQEKQRDTESTRWFDDERIVSFEESIDNLQKRNGMMSNPDNEQLFTRNLDIKFLNILYLEKILNVYQDYLNDPATDKSLDDNSILHGSLLVRIIDLQRELQTSQDIDRIEKALLAEVKNTIDIMQTDRSIAPFSRIFSMLICLKTALKRWVKNVEKSQALARKEIEIQENLKRVEGECEQYSLDRLQRRMRYEKLIGKIADQNKDIAQLKERLDKNTAAPNAIEINELLKSAMEEGDTIEDKKQEAEQQYQNAQKQYQKELTSEIAQDMKEWKSNKSFDKQMFYVHQDYEEIQSNYKTFITAKKTYVATLKNILADISTSTRIIKTQLVQLEDQIIERDKAIAPFYRDNETPDVSPLSLSDSPPSLPRAPSPSPIHNSPQSRHTFFAPLPPTQASSSAQEKQPAETRFFSLQDLRQYQIPEEPCQSFATWIKDSVELVEFVQEVERELPIQIRNQQDEDNKKNVVKEYLDNLGKRYKKLAMKYHPDKNPPQGTKKYEHAEIAFKWISEYQTRAIDKIEAIFSGNVYEYSGENAAFYAWFGERLSVLRKDYAEIRRDQEFLKKEFAERRKELVRMREDLRLDRQKKDALAEEIHAVAEEVHAVAEEVHALKERVNNTAGKKNTLFDRLDVLEQKTEALLKNRGILADEQQHTVPIHSNTNKLM